jgi:pimeloyl-ACP methyl ester carboxylesterase
MDTSPHRSDFVQVNGIRVHYLDWGGGGPVLLFLTGMGLSAHIYDQFAPRFTDRFHVMAVTRRGQGDSDCPETGYNADTLTDDLRQFMDAVGIDRAILVGHSMANVELCHFSALYPDRVLKLIFLDAAYDRTKFGVLHEKNPLREVQPPHEDQFTIEDYIAYTKKNFPMFAEIWSELWDEEILHSVTKDAAGRIVDKTSDQIGAAIIDGMKFYSPESSSLKVPVLSIYAIWEDAYFPDHLTEDQKAQVLEFINTVRLPLQRECIEQFRRDVPHARIVEIPHGHHYCFIKHAQLVYDEMREFLRE